MARRAILISHEACFCGRGFQPRFSRLGSRSHRGEKSDFIGSGLTMSYEYDIFMHIKEMNWRPHENHAQHRG
jgi:hypothetical protein